MLNISTWFVSANGAIAIDTGSATARNFPSGLTLIPSGEASAENGEPGMGVSDPLGAMLNSVILLEPLLAAIKNMPFGVAESEIPRNPEPPVGNGDPATRLKVPVLVLMLNTLTSFEPPLDAKRRLPTVLTVTPFEAISVAKQQVPPVANGDPGTGVSVPFEATEKPETVLEPEPKMSLV
jgi:hypothetical protein